MLPTIIEDMPSPAIAEPAQTVMVELPKRIPPHCVLTAARDYTIPEGIILAVLKQESGGQVGLVRANANGSFDVGPAQINSSSWLPYFQSRYGVRVETLTNDMCTALRAQAYVLRREANSPACRGKPIWCAVGRYHAPGNSALQSSYVLNVARKLGHMLQTGKFE